VRDVLEIGQRVLVIGGPDTGKTGTMLSDGTGGRYIIRLDEPELWLLPVATEIGKLSTDTIVADPADCKPLS
jgi:hypothetical protein